MATDPLTLTVTAAVLLSAALLAGVAPAWRAGCAYPNEVLRES